MDFIFDEKTGKSSILIDFQDEEMTALEMNETIRSGELRERILEAAEAMLGTKARQDLESGRIGLVCLDNEPGGGPTAAEQRISDTIASKKEIEQ